jgi:hypothetical protein
MAVTKPCSICSHPQREQIDRAVIAGNSVRKTAHAFDVSASAVQRHKKICMKRTLPAVTAPLPVPAYQTPAEMAIATQTARSVASRAESLVVRMEQAFNECQGTGNYDTLVKCAKEVREGLRLLAQLSGQLGPNNQVNLQVNNATPSITMDPAWPVLMRCLDRLAPDIKRELLAEMAALEGRS